MSKADAFLGVQMAISQARREMEKVNMSTKDIGITIELPPNEWVKFLHFSDRALEFTSIRNSDAVRGDTVKLMGAIIRVKQ